MARKYIINSKKVEDFLLTEQQSQISSVQEQFDYVADDINNISSVISSLDISQLNSNVKTLSNDVSSLSSNVKTLSNDVSSLSSNVKQNESRISVAEINIDDLQQKLEDISTIDINNIQEIINILGIIVERFGGNKYDSIFEFTINQDGPNMLLIDKFINFLEDSEVFEIEKI